MKLSKSIGIVEQVRVAFAPQYRMAALIGAMLGAIVPLSTFIVSHYELDTSNPLDLRWLVVLGGLAYSATTVYSWGKLAVSSRFKAFVFTILIEGVMSLATDLWLSVIALAFLVGINAIATGVTLARGMPVDKHEPEELPSKPYDAPYPALLPRELAPVRTVVADKREAKRARDRARRAAQRAKSHDEPSVSAS